MAGRRIQARVRKRAARESKQDQDNLDLNRLEEQAAKLSPEEVQKLALRQSPDKPHTFQPAEVIALDNAGLLEPLAPKSEQEAKERLNPRGQAAKRHWAEHLPSLYAGMVKYNYLYRSLWNAQTAADQLYRRLRQQGHQPLVAREMADKELIYRLSEQEQLDQDNQNQTLLETPSLVAAQQPATT